MAAFVLLSYDDPSNVPSHFLWTFTRFADAFMQIQKIFSQILKGKK